MKLETERVIIREANLDDAPFILKLLNEKSYIEMIRDSGVRSEAEARTYIEEKYIHSYRTNGFGLFVVETRQNPGPVGICGFVKRAGLNVPDLGFALLEKEEGQGFIFESAKAVLEYGRKVLNLSEVGAITTRDNQRSVNILVKLGFSFQEKMTLPGDTKEFEFYRVS